MLNTLFSHILCVKIEIHVPNLQHKNQDHAIIFSNTPNILMFDHELEHVLEANLENL